MADVPPPNNGAGSSAPTTSVSPVKSNFQLAQLLVEQTQANEELQSKVDDLQTRLARTETLLRDMRIITDAEGRVQQLLGSDEAKDEREKAQDRIRGTMASYEDRIRSLEKSLDLANARKAAIEDGWYKIRDFLHGRASEQYDTIMSFNQLVQTGHGSLTVAAPSFSHTPHSYPYGSSYPTVTSPVSSRSLPPIQAPRHHIPSEQTPGSRHPNRTSLPYPPGPPPPHGPPGTLPPPPGSSSSYPPQPRRDSQSLLERPYTRRGSDYLPPRGGPPPPLQHGQPGEKRRRRSTSQDSVDVDEMILQTASSPRNPYPAGTIGVPRKRTYEEYGNVRQPETRNASGSGSFSDSPKRRKVFSGSEIDVTVAGHAYGRSPPSGALGSAHVTTSPQTAHAIVPPSAGVPTATPTQTTTSTGQVIQAYPPQNPEGQRICRQCGMPGRYKDGKCVEKWGPGPLGPGTVCDRCRKRMRRVERRGTLDQAGDPGSALPSAGPARSNSKPDIHAPHHTNSLPTLPVAEPRVVPRSTALPSASFPPQPHYDDDRRPNPPPAHPGKDEHPMELDADADGEEDAEGEDDADGEIEAEIAGTIGENHAGPMSDSPQGPSPTLPQTIRREDYSRLQPLSDASHHEPSPKSEENHSGSGSSQRSPIPPRPSIIRKPQEDHVMDDVEDEFVRAANAAEERGTGGP